MLLVQGQPLTQGLLLFAFYFLLKRHRGEDRPGRPPSGFRSCVFFFESFHPLFFFFSFFFFRRLGVQSRKVEITCRCALFDACNLRSPSFPLSFVLAAVLSARRRFPLFPHLLDRVYLLVSRKDRASRTSGQRLLLADSSFRLGLFAPPVQSRAGVQLNNI